MTISATTQGLRPGVCTSSNRPATPFEGQMIYETDTDLTYVYGGSAWQQVAGGTAVGNSGLVYIKSQTIGSGVTAVTVSNAFSSAYDNYKIVINGGTASGTVPIRVALGSSVTAYYGSLVYATYSSTAVAAATMNNGSYWIYAGTTPTGPVGATFELQNPFIACVTSISAPYFDATNAGHLSGYHGVNTSYTDFTVTPNSGTWSSCVITVYGYRKA